MAHSSRGWTGARTPQALKRVRQSTRRNVFLAPRRSAAKTEVKDALQAAASGDVEATRTAVAEAASALDRAAKVGAIHPNNAARRKSRLMRRANAALGGEALVATAKPQRQVSKSAAAKAAKTRIAAGKASKAKGEQTAAGKARAALSKSSRSTEASAAAAAAAATSQAADWQGEHDQVGRPPSPRPSRRRRPRPASRARAEASTGKASTSKASGTKAASKSSTTKAATKSASKSTKDAS